MPTPSPLILAFGDSLIAGYGLPAGASFPAQLERRLRDRHPTARVVNAGVSGDTTADALRRLPRALSGLDRRPDLAIVQLGPNDVLQQLPPSQTRSNLDAICVEFDRCGVPVLLTTVAPPAFLRSRARAYVSLHNEVAARHAIAICPFFPADILGHPAMVLADRVHPNAKAIAAVVESVLPTVELAFAKS